MGEEKSDQGREPNPDRLTILKQLPTEITKTLSREETNAFLFDEELPDSLQEKLKDFLVDV
ncbi:MAG: hypothetical protein V2J25_17325 [Desulfatiglans sp.]|jgi:hypothetical protein|nr:hypothetical protein [Thermodesulfobacteriota bacterium]MEE4354620.1 hypothetical protein [Desulfatiglans sp.]